MRYGQMRMAARSEAKAMAGPLGEPSDNEDAAFGSNPKGRGDSRRISSSELLIQDSSVCQILATFLRREVSGRSDRRPHLGLK
jgi:hypothetical protein